MQIELQIGLYYASLHTRIRHLYRNELYSLSKMSTCNFQPGIHLTLEAKLGLGLGLEFYQNLVTSRLKKNCNPSNSIFQQFSVIFSGKNG